MNVRQLRAAPVLPEEYLEVRAALEDTLGREPLFARPVDVAIFHAVSALERNANCRDEARGGPWANNLWWGKWVTIERDQTGQNNPDWVWRNSQ